LYGQVAAVAVAAFARRKSRKRYISPIRGEAFGERIFTKFCISADMPDVIICANFGSEKFSGLESRLQQCCAVAHSR